MHNHFVLCCWCCFFVFFWALNPNPKLQILDHLYKDKVLAVPATCMYWRDFCLFSFFAKCNFVVCDKRIPSVCPFCARGWCEGLDGEGGRLGKSRSLSLFLPLPLWGGFCQSRPALCSTDVVALSGSTKAQISPTGSFYSLAIVSACLTRPLMNAAVSQRSHTRQKEHKTNHLSRKKSFARWYLAMFTWISNFPLWLCSLFQKLYIYHKCWATVIKKKKK